MQDIQAEAQIGVVPAGGATEQISLAEQGGQLTGKIAELQRPSCEQHVCETWMQRQIGHPFSMSGDLSLCIECVEAGEQLSRLGHSPGWWGSEPGQLGWIGRAPEAQFEKQWRQVGVEHFRRATRGQRLVLRRGPEARTDARFEAAGTTTTLLGRILCDADGLQSRKSRARIEARHAQQAGIDDDAYPIDC